MPIGCLRQSHGGSGLSLIRGLRELARLQKVAAVGGELRVPEVIIEEVVNLLRNATRTTVGAWAGEVVCHQRRVEKAASTRREIRAVSPDSSVYPGGIPSN